MLFIVVGVVIAATWVDANDVEAQSAIEEISRTEDAARFERIALGHLAASQLTLAEDAARRAIQASTDYAPAYNTLGLVQLRSGDPASARDSFVRARELDPTLFAAHMNEGALALDVRDFEAAEIAFLHGTEIRPRDYDAWISLGVSRRGLNDVEGARIAYEQAQTLDPSRPEAYFDLGLLFQLHSDGTELTLNTAVGFFQQFLQSAGARPEYAPAAALLGERCRVDARVARRRPSLRSRCGPQVFDPQSMVFPREVVQIHEAMGRIRAQAARQVMTNAVAAFRASVLLSGGEP